jgi:hypothetical protein
MNTIPWMGYRSLALRFVLLLLVGAGLERAQSQRQKISLREAKQLAYEVIKVHNAGADLINSPRSFDPDFFFFAATWANSSGSPIIGYFAVNPWTGDVWNSAGCEHLSSKRLERLQQDIRKRFHFSSEDYAKLRAKKPMCGTD